MSLLCLHSGNKQKDMRQRSKYVVLYLNSRKDNGRWKGYKMPGCAISYFTWNSGMSSIWNIEEMHTTLKDTEDLLRSNIILQVGPVDSSSSFCFLVILRLIL